MPVLTHTPVPSLGRCAHASALILLPLLAGACSSHTGIAGLNPASDPQVPQTTSAADAGLEVTTFISGLDNRSFAAALAPYADQPIPISRELEELWDAHGLRMISLPLEDAPALIAKLQTGGAGGSQKQWLGQAYSWTEAARAQEFPSRIVALDAERIRLNPGVLRLLVRSWLEPVPPQPTVGTVIGNGGMVGISGAADEAANSPSAILRVELVPQNRELVSPDTLRDPLASQPSIDAESQGQLFSRLYAKMSIPPGRALLIVPERPSVVWRTLAAQPASPAAGPEADAPRHTAASTDSDNPWPKHADSSSTAPASSSHAPATPPRSGATPKVGEVVRAAPMTASAPPNPPDSQDSVPDSSAGPSGARVPTLGEALLVAPSSRVSDRSRPQPPQRTMVLLVPHLPHDFHLLGPASGATSQRGQASP